MSKYYTIDSEKLDRITAIVNKNTDPKVTEEIVEAHICADWREGEEHQRWINNASDTEIADWVTTTTY